MVHFQKIYVQPPNDTVVERRADKVEASGSMEVKSGDTESQENKEPEGVEPEQRAPEWKSHRNKAAGISMTIKETRLLINNQHHSSVSIINRLLQNEIPRLLKVTFNIFTETF